MNYHTHYNYSGDTGISGKHRARINRDTEFLQSYRRVLDLMLEHRVPDARRAAVDFTIMNGHPRYYVSYDRAYVVVRSIIRNNKVPVKPSMQALMWLEIASKVKELIEREQVTLPHALQFVLDHCRASRYYITPQYAYNHIRHISKTPSKNTRYDHHN